MWTRLLLLLFIHRFGVSYSIELKIFEDLLEVRSQNGLFFPLCSKSFHQKYGEQACASISSTFVSHSTVSLNQYTYSIGCTSSVCFTFLSSFCKTGVKVFCSSSLCSPGTLQVGTKCLSISTVPVQGYSEAKEYCSPFSLISSLRPTDIESIRETILPTFTDSRMFLTSGLREGSTWKWGNGDRVDQDVGGSGRCLALQSGRLVAVDCDTEAFVFCESGRECVGKNKTYAGTANRTADGENCLRWDDPTVLFQRDVEVDIANHNYCRFIEQDGKKTPSPVCYVKPHELGECNIPNCPESLNDAVTLENGDTCPSSSFSCDNGSKCISEKFQCDYEVDCNDGTDEQNCDDYLQYYELIGAYRLVENIIEVWTFIPHVQGCARKCRESLLMCEAFSYEPKTQTCLLTDTSHTFSSLARKVTSLYYRRRFSSKDVLFEVENRVLYATKLSQKGQVCDENFSREKLSSICRLLGFGDPIYTRATRRSDGSSEQQQRRLSRPHLSSDVSSASPSPVLLLRRPSRSATTALHRPAWNLSCLREPNCTSTIASICQPIRCSRCQEAACNDGSCIGYHQLCDGHVDCASGDDESECRGKAFRLANGSDTSGYVEVLFRTKWEPLCADRLHEKQMNFICDTLRLGERGSALSTNISISSGFDVECPDDCTIRRASVCFRQARIACISANGISSVSQCGLRYVEVNARDAARVRVARVVGGFETVPGAFPWTAALRIKATKNHHCGASILDRTHLITAAHCFEEDERVASYEVVVGDWDNNVTEGNEQVFQLQRVHFYPLYKDIFSHDIAILEIPYPGIVFGEYAQPICLPTQDFVYTPGKQCVVSGWGSMGLRYAQRLQAALIPIIDRSDCANSSQIYTSMSRSAFCAGYLEGGIDSCQGDSGGPFACRREDGAFVLAGIISWGDGCAQKKQPGIYTMVAPYLTWINTVLSGQ